MKALTAGTVTAIVSCLENIKHMTYFLKKKKQNIEKTKAAHTLDQSSFTFRSTTLKQFRCFFFKAFYIKTYVGFIDIYCISTLIIIVIFVSVSFGYIYAHIQYIKSIILQWDIVFLCMDF